jgi:hypothetical protein
MAKESKKKEAVDGAQKQNQRKILWDHSEMKSVYANVFNVVPTQEEITILFGMIQAWQSGQRDLKVRLSDRVVLSPFAAKRLCLILNNVMRAYEAKFGELNVDFLRPNAATQADGASEQEPVAQSG